MDNLAALLPNRAERQKLADWSETDLFLELAAGRVQQDGCHAGPEFSSAHARALAITFVSPLILAHSNVCTVAEGTWKPMLLHSSRRTSFSSAAAEMSAGVGGAAAGRRQSRT